MDMAAPKTIFVTGVNGHIGNHIVRDLLENGYKVIGSVRDVNDPLKVCLLYTSPSPRDQRGSRMPSSA